MANADKEDIPANLDAAHTAAGPQAREAARVRGRNIRILAGGLFAALVLGVFIVVAFGGSGSKPAPVDAPTADARAATTALLSGIQQHGFVLGDPKAPMNLVEFLDVQCPFCAAHQVDQQPTVIRELVRTGKATITMQPIVVLGDQSQTGRVVAARMAGLNKAWSFMNVWYLIQPQERTGYVTPMFLTKIASAALARAPTPAEISTKPDAAATTLLSAIDANATALKVDQTPFFAIGRTGQPIATYKQYDTGKSGKPAGVQLVDAVNAAAKKAGA